MSVMMMMMMMNAIVYAVLLHKFPHPVSFDKTLAILQVIF